MTLHALLLAAALTSPFAHPAFSQATGRLSPPDLPGQPSRAPAPRPVPPAPRSLALPSAVRVLPPPGAPPAVENAEGASIQKALAPAYRSVVGSDDGEEIRAAMPTVQMVAGLLQAVPRSESTVAGGQLCAILAQIIRQNEQFARQYHQPASTALDRGGDAANRWIFSENTERRWRITRSQLGAQAESAWQRLTSAETADAPGYSVAFQTMLARAAAEHQQRELERTATLIKGKVVRTQADGALISVDARASAERPGERLPASYHAFVTGLDSVADGEQVQVLGHRDGIHRYVSADGTERTAENYRNYRRIQP